jgi:predicted AAA+ superfamily ATPase
MNSLFIPHNLLLQSIEHFRNGDPHLSTVIASPYRFCSRLVRTLSHLSPGIYTLTGGRQVGKTTLLKQVMLHLLETKKVSATRMMYLTGEVIPDDRALHSHLEGFLTEAGRETGTCLICLDEVTYIKDWHRTVKFLADAGMLRNAALIITGSDMVFLKELVMQLPGRRGSEDTVDFHFYPLSFREFVDLRNSLDTRAVELAASESAQALPAETMQAFYAELDLYLKTGGYLRALCDMSQKGTISAATTRTYTDWIRGDMLKRGKHESAVQEILKALVRKAGSQITWNSFTGEVSLLHHNTIAEYCLALEAMDVIFIQQALREDRLEGAPKKAKRIIFTDPFIARAVAGYVNEPPPDDASLVESVVISHCRRNWPTYYIKNKGEIDCAYVRDNRSMPVEVKWTSRIRREHLIMASRYQGCILAAKVDRVLTVENIPVVPIPFFLLRI